MSIQKFVAGAALIALAAGSIPAATTLAPAPALADGAASTRNILLLGGAAAAYLIIQHNKKVHAQQAAEAQQQAETQASANNASAAYGSEKNAYDREAALNADLNREVAYQHSIIVQQQNLLASAGLHPVYIAQKPNSTHTVSHAKTASQQVAVTTQGWGWGTI
jgi:hypothetical protein